METGRGRWCGQAWVGYVWWCKGRVGCGRAGVRVGNQTGAGQVAKRQRREGSGVKVGRHVKGRQRQAGSRQGRRCVCSNQTQSMLNTGKECKRGQAGGKA